MAALDTNSTLPESYMFVVLTQLACISLKLRKECLALYQHYVRLLYTYRCNPSVRDSTHCVFFHESWNGMPMLSRSITELTVKGNFNVMISPGWLPATI